MVNNNFSGEFLRSTCSQRFLESGICILSGWGITISGDHVILVLLLFPPLMGCKFSKFSRQDLHVFS